MRNTLLILFVALVYALASEMDFTDAELMNSHAVDISADASCLAPRVSCDVQTARFLALERN
jgi:hypothetical protein